MNEMETSANTNTAIADVEVITGNKTKFSEFIEFFRDLAIILVIVLVIRSYGVAPFQISGNSMTESYANNEFILVDKFSYANFFGLYQVGNPKRGDVAVLMPHAKNNKEYYIKRVIGLPGDTLKFENGEVFIKVAGTSEFVKLNEGYLSAVNNGGTYLPGESKEREIEVPEDSYFVMGDNRVGSADSRSCFFSCSIAGSKYFVSRKDIVGKVFVSF